MFNPRTILRAVLLAALGGLVSTREAAAHRFALLVGNNQGQRHDAALRFAESDTARLADILTQLGGFSPGATTVLLARNAREVRQALTELGDRVRATPGEHLVLVYYSGHADAQSLHLGYAVLPLTELRDTIVAMPAATKVLILDACQAGVLTRPKGGRSVAGFDVDLGGGASAKGLAILAASSGSELAQESDQLGASVFTHYLEVGLAGLADRNRDGSVALAEVFDYAAGHTLAATLGTTTGPQHPTFRLDLSGSDDLILTRPGAPGSGYGQLKLDVSGWYFVRRGDGTIAAEVTSRGGETLALPAGAYEVTRRAPNNLDVAEVMVADGQATTLSATPSRQVAFGRMVRKGESPDRAYAMAVATSMRTSMQELGTSWGGSFLGRMDLSAASVELRLGLDRAHSDTAHLSATTWNVSAGAALLRLHDLGPSHAASGGTRGLLSRLTWGYGLTAGVARLSQRLDDGASRVGWAPFFGPLGRLEVSSGRFFALADLGASLYSLSVQQGETAQRVWQFALSSAVGAGAAF